MEREILLLGDERLYQVSTPVRQEELPALADTIADLHDTLHAFRAKYGVGRAIAAPQIGVFKRLIYMDTGTPTVFLNPELSFPDEEKMEVLDDCMSFPELLVRVLRHRRCTVGYRDENWQPRQVHYEDSLSELIQHEYDHLDGVLATMRAKDSRAFVLKASMQG